jgi:glycosyltransferase involved in cell wall biosynthesis
MHHFLGLPIVNLLLIKRKYEFLLYSAKLDHELQIENLKSDHERYLEDMKRHLYNISEKKILDCKSPPIDNHLESSNSNNSLSKTILLSMVKNEADIIESFVRHNHIFFDKTIIIDNGSTDETYSILNALKCEGLPIQIESDSIIGYSQKEKMKKRYVELTKNEDFDFIVIIDADEFINSSDKNYLRKSLKHKDTKYFFEWANYIPIGVGRNDISDPLQAIKHRNNKISLRKVVIPNFGEDAQFVQIWQGNHDFEFSVRHLHFSLLDAKLAHFPVRSINQIESKALIGWPSYLIKNKNAKWSHEGLQWRIIYERIEEAGISEADLVNIADCYSDIENVNFENNHHTNFVYDPITPNYDSIKFLNRPQKSLTKFAKFCESIIYENWHLRDEIERNINTNSPYNDRKSEITSQSNVETNPSTDDRDDRDRDFNHADRYKIENLIDRTGNLDIIFISEVKHAKFQTLRYRCFNIIDYLSTIGWNCGLAYSEDVDKEWFSKIRPSIAIFIRVDRNDRLDKLISTYKSDGVKIIFDIDDFVFDEIVFLQKITVPGIAKIPELLNSDWAKPYRDEAKFYQHLIRLADVVTTTTPYLSEKTALLNCNSYVIPNSLSASQIEIAERHNLTYLDEYIRIGYFSGSPTHNSDFLVAAEALYFTMRRHPKVKLVLVGFIEVPSYFLALGDGRIERHPPLDASGYFRVIGKCDINIAPLENSNFNQGKSELKVFEAAAWKIPTIASATDTLTRCITDGHDGIIAHDRHSWELSLEKLIVDSTYRRAIGSNAKNSIATRFSFFESGKCAEDIYNKILGRN